MKRKIFFLIAIILEVFILAFIFGISVEGSRKDNDQQTFPGIWTLDPTTPLNKRDTMLSGKWEYYPDQLIVSGNEIASHEGQIQSYHPDIEMPDHQTDNSGIRVIANETADHIYLPAINIKEAFTHKKASYRMVVENIQNEDRDSQMLVLPGYMKGNYKVFLNGQETLLRMPSPWSYPIYLMGDEPVQEVIVEITDYSGVMNVCPRIVSLGIAMSEFDIMKDILSISLTMILASFITLIIAFFVNKHSGFRLLLLVGVAFAIAYILQSSWMSGYASDLTAIIPVRLFFFLFLIFIQLGAMLFAINNRKHYPTVFPKTHLQISLIVLVISIVFNITSLIVCSEAMVLLSYPFMLAALFLWVIRIMKNIQWISFDGLISQYGFLFLILGAGSQIAYTYYSAYFPLIIIMPLAIIIYLVFLLISVYQYQSAVVKQTQRMLELEKEMNQMQMAMFSSQIQPHFLYNTLNTIQEKCYTDPKIAADMIVHFSKYLRRNIDFMSFEELIPFSGELEHINNYIYIQKKRFGEELDYEQDIRFADFKLPPLSVQPLIENAVKYGVRSQDGWGKVVLTVTADEKKISITVRNSGPTFTEEDIKENHSIDNIRKRLETLLNGELKIYSNSEGTGATVEILIPRTEQSRRAEEMQK